MSKNMFWPKEKIQTRYEFPFNNMAADSTGTAFPDVKFFIPVCYFPGNLRTSSSLFFCTFVIVYCAMSPNYFDSQILFCRVRHATVVERSSHCTVLFTSRSARIYRTKWVCGTEKNGFTKWFHVKHARFCPSFTPDSNLLIEFGSCARRSVGVCSISDTHNDARETHAKLSNYTVILAFLVCLACGAAGHNHFDLIVF